MFSELGRIRGIVLVHYKTPKENLYAVSTSKSRRLLLRSQCVRDATTRYHSSLQHADLTSLTRAQRYGMDGSVLI